MTPLGAALFPVAEKASATAGEAVGANVVAIVRLAANGRTWFITAVHRTAEGMQVDGYEPGCEYSDERRFRVESDFFEVAARANDDELLIEVLDEPVPIEELEDSAF